MRILSDKRPLRECLEKRAFKNGGIKEIDHLEIIFRITAAIMRVCMQELDILIEDASYLVLTSMPLYFYFFLQNLIRREVC